MALAAAINVQPIKKFRTSQTARLTIGFLAMRSQPIAPRMLRNASSPASPQQFPEFSFQTHVSRQCLFVDFQFPFWCAADGAIMDED
jgi:hypothetical protein